MTTGVHLSPMRASSRRAGYCSSKTSFFVVVVTIWLLLHSSAPRHCCERNCSRYRWTKVTAIAPSPTADATRFTELCRTSPAANDPGTLVSRKKGWRSSVQHAGGRPSENKSEPVTRYPLGSRMMAVSLAQSVFGAPPMQTKSHAESTHAAVPVLIGMKLKPIELDDTTREKVANEVSLARSLEPEKAHASRARYRCVVGCAMFWHGDLLIVGGQNVRRGTHRTASYGTQARAGSAPSVQVRVGGPRRPVPRRGWRHPPPPSRSPLRYAAGRRKQRPRGGMCGRRPSAAP